MGLTAPAGAAARPEPPPEVEAFGRDLARRLPDLHDGRLVGLYLHGSAALGDWRSSVSDVDVLMIVDAPSRSGTGRLAGALADALGEAARRCPGKGLEASVVSASAAGRPMAPYPFLVHVAGSPGGSIRVVDGSQRAGDEDLALHYLVCAQRGIALLGPPASQVIGAIDRATALRQMARELRWGQENADAAYALLNACRALAYERSGDLLSKSEAAQWALTRGIGPADSITAALAARTGSPSPGPLMERDFIDDAITVLIAAASR